MSKLSRRTSAWNFENAAGAFGHRLRTAPLFLRRLQFPNDLFGRRGLAAKNRADRIVFFQDWHVAIMHLKFVAVFRVRLAVGIEITKTEQVFKSLPPPPFVRMQGGRLPGLSDFF